jgi:hypothetical protein
VEHLTSPRARPEPGLPAARGSGARVFWRYAPASRAGLLIAVLGIAALVMTGQVASERPSGGSSGQIVTTAAAVTALVIVAHVARLVPLGDAYLRQDVGERFAATIYGAAVVAALIAVLVTEVWLTAACVGALVVLGVTVVVRRSTTGADAC